MFRALVALGLTSQAHALFCIDKGAVCPEGSTFLHSSGGGVQTYFCGFYRPGYTQEDCPSGWIFGGYFECQLIVPDAIKDDAVADCSVNMCPDGYVPHGGLCVDSCPDGWHLKENLCSPCQAGEFDYEGTCVGSMGLVHTAEGWVPHTCSTISESYKNGQCCQ